MFYLPGTPDPKPDLDTSSNTPRSPDYLLILIISLFMLSLLIAFLTDVPALLGE